MAVQTASALSVMMPFAGVVRLQTVGDVHRHNGNNCRCQLTESCCAAPAGSTAEC